MFIGFLTVSSQTGDLYKIIRNIDIIIVRQKRLQDAVMRKEDLRALREQDALRRRNHPKRICASNVQTAAYSGAHVST